MLGLAPLVVLCTAALQPRGTLPPPAPASAASAASAAPIGRRAVLLGVASLTPVLPALALDVNGAIPATSAGTGCKTASCQREAIAELNKLLDVSGVPKNADGDAAAHLPSIDVRRFQGARKDVAPTRVKARVTIEKGLAGGNYPQLIWVVDEKSGEVLGARAFEADEEAPYQFKCAARPPHPSVPVHPPCAS